jgi:hypothetical protein
MSKQEFVDNVKRRTFDGTQAEERMADKQRADTKKNLTRKYSLFLFLFSTFSIELYVIAFDFCSGRASRDFAASFCRS